LPAFGSIGSNPYGVKKPKIDSAFDDLLSREINISPGIRSAASNSQNHLRDFLSAEALRDSTFPHVLEKVDSDFLGGSFARHTKNWPLDDIDIYVPLDGYNLLYMQNGLRLPYLVQSDGVTLWNPLLTDRWMNGRYISSTKVISEFCRVLTRHYPCGTEVRPDTSGVSLSVRMTHGETLHAEGLGYDIVPCFSMKPDASNEFEFYLIPDGSGGWARTNPKIDTDVCEILHAFHNRLYRKIVKLTKYWNEVRLNGTFSSYYIEFAISTDFWRLKTSGRSVSSISEGLAAAFSALERASDAGDQQSWIVAAPPIRKPDLTLLQSATLTLARAASQLAWLYEETGKDAEALKEWTLVFGEAFAG
jgi:hypothetical protein